MTGQVLLSSDEADGSWLPSASKRTACCLNLKCSVGFEDPLQVGYCQWSAVHCVPLRMARSGAIALWCQTVMSRVQGNTINTMARISLLFGISRIGYLARHYLERDKKRWMCYRSAFYIYNIYTYIYIYIYILLRSSHF